MQFAMHSRAASLKRAAHRPKSERPEPALNHRFAPLDTVDPYAIEVLLDRAFGTDRHARTAYRVRAGTDAIPELSVAALRADGALAGSIQCWPVELRRSDGAVPMIMVGPVAVDPRFQQAGLGKRLMTHMLSIAERSALPGADAMMLIGDPEYYERFFGFSADHTGQWQLPGPFERNRLLARGARVPAIAGDVAARFVRSGLPTPAPMP